MIKQQYRTTKITTTTKTFCPDDWEFKSADMHINYKPGNSENVTLWMDYVDNYTWSGRKRQAKCSGGGYDMVGTVVGNWMMEAFLLEIQLQKLGFLANRMYYSSSDESWDVVKIPHIFKIGDTRFIVPGESRLYGVTAKYDSFTERPVEYIHYDGACGFQQMEQILYRLGYYLKWLKRSDKSRNKDYYELHLIDDETYYRNNHKVLVLPKMGNLIFQKEEQAILPEGLEKESLFDWLNDPDNIHHSIIKIRVQDTNVLEAVFNTHLGQGWEECKYLRKNECIMWESYERNKTGWQNSHPIRSMTLLNEESGIEVVPFNKVKELN